MRLPFDYTLYSLRGHPEFAIAMAPDKVFGPGGLDRTIGSFW